MPYFAPSADAVFSEVNGAMVSVATFRWVSTETSVTSGDRDMLADGAAAVVAVATGIGEVVV
jgi:hypothetical protein